MVGRLERPLRAAGSQGSQNEYCNKKLYFIGSKLYKLNTLLKEHLIYNCNYFHVGKSVGAAMAMHNALLQATPLLLSALRQSLRQCLQLRPLVNIYNAFVYTPLSAVLNCRLIGTISVCR